MRSQKPGRVGSGIGGGVRTSPRPAAAGLAVLVVLRKTWVPRYGKREIERKYKTFLLTAAEQAAIREALLVERSPMHWR